IGSLAFARRSFHSNGDDGLVVECFFPGGVLLDGIEQGVYYLLGAHFPAAAGHLFGAFASKQLSRGIAGVQNAVAEEYEKIAGLEAERKFIVSGIVEKAQRQAGCVNHFGLSALAINRTRQAGIRDLQRALAFIPERIDERNKLP